MNTPFDMSYLLAFGFIGLCIYIGVFLRAKIKLFQTFLVPACMIGGIIGMIIINLGIVPLKIELFQAIAYHFFIISFISIGLTGRQKQTAEKGEGKKIVRGALWMGLINGASMASQAVIGCLMIFFFTLIGTKTPLQLGLFLPLGFTQGPGQALAVGKAWESMGLTSAVSIGLAFAAIGFFFALFVGIPIVNWGIRRGFTQMGRIELADYFKRGIYSKDQIKESTGMMTTHSGNVDSLAFQAGAVGICYLLTYLAYYGIQRIIGTLSPAAWGFFFFYGMLMGLGMRFLMNKAGVGYLLNPQTQNRITSFGVDILVAATLISVELAVVWKYIVPLVVISLVGGIWTTAYMLYFGRRLDDLGFERMCVQYGCNTGTVSTGLLLLRVIDPEFKTSVALETGLYSIVAAPFILGAMLVIMYAPQWGLAVYHQVGIYLGFFLLALVLLKIFKLWGKRAW
jgi:ESS family glutamate:Na+ symporter